MNVININGCKANFYKKVQPVSLTRNRYEVSRKLQPLVWIQLNEICFLFIDDV